MESTDMLQSTLAQIDYTSQLGATLKSTNETGLELDSPSLRASSESTAHIPGQGQDTTCTYSADSGGSDPSSPPSSRQPDPTADPDNLEVGPCQYASKPVTNSDRVAANGSLLVRSKRTERLRKRLEKKASKKPSRNQQPLTPFDLPPELLFNVLAFLRPSDLFALSRSCRTLRDYVLAEERLLARATIDLRYSVLEKCFPFPALAQDLDSSCLPALLNPDRQNSANIHKQFQAVQSPDPNVVCTCLTCMLRWNALNLIVDFAHWQSNLDAGEPIPVIPRGKRPQWNEDLILAHSAIVTRAFGSPLWYARILERHLASTVNSIRRHAANKGNQRRRFVMTTKDEEAGTDRFLEATGPPTVDFPFIRDSYYMLEAYLPNRGWSSEEGKWLYMPDWHQRDLEWVVNRWGKSTS